MDLIHCNPMRFDMRLGQTVCMDVVTPNLYEDVHHSASGLKLLSDKKTALRQPLPFWISLRYDVAFLLFSGHIPHLPAISVIVHSFGTAKVSKAIEEMVECIHRWFDCFFHNRSRFYHCRSFFHIVSVGSEQQFVCFTF